MGDVRIVRPSASASVAATESTSLVDGLIIDITRALFGSYGARLELDGSPVQATLETANFLTIIGFSSSTFNGYLLLALPRALAEKTAPAPEVELADWCGELSNQLLGRLKNRLVEYEVFLDMALPVVISGGRFALPAKTRPIARLFCFVFEGGKFFVRLEAELSPDVELVRRADERGRVLDEGELLLF